MIKLLQHTEINTEQWNQLLETSPHASFFQTKACYDFYCSLTFMKGFVYAVEEDNQLVGLMCGYIIADGGKIKRFFSRRAIVPGGLLLYENISDKALSSLLEFSQKQLAKRAIYIEIRNYTDYATIKTIMQANEFKYIPYLNIQVPTTHGIPVDQRLHASKKRQIRQSLDHGAGCLLSENSDDLESFFQILQNLYQNKIKKPLFPIEFFIRLLKQDFSRFFVVKKDDKVLGGILCVTNQQVLYEWFICGEQDPEKNIYPSALATWTAITYAHENGYRYFDFMGAGKPDENYGVREFKKQFGGEITEPGRFRFVCSRVLFYIASNALTLIRKI